MPVFRGWRRTSSPREQKLQSQIVARVENGLTCTACGGNDLGLDGRHDSHSVVRCRACGRELGTFSDLAKQVMQGARLAVAAEEAA